MAPNDVFPVGAGPGGEKTGKFAQKLYFKLDIWPNLVYTSLSLEGFLR
jgi:hypothetical protein